MTKKIKILFFAAVLGLQLGGMVYAEEMNAATMGDDNVSENSTQGMDQMDQMNMPDQGSAQKVATAKISGTAEGSLISGQVTLTETPEGVQVEAVVNNVPNPGKHGFHIHENGSCADAGKAAGGHFNPNAVAHGFLPHDGMEHAHLGDLGNIEIDANGVGTLAILLQGVNLSSGESNVSGKSIVLHEKEDDFGQPTGNAGGRIGCGIITSPENTEAGPAVVSK